MFLFLLRFGLLEHVVSCIYSLWKHVTGVHLERLMNKFVENDFEKVQRLVELHDTFYKATLECEKKIQQKMKELISSRKGISDEDEDSFYLMKLDAGLFTLQLVDLVLNEQNRFFQC